MSEEKLRLQCFDNVLRSDSRTSTPASSPWRLVRTREPQGKREVVSIMRTPDLSRTDPDLAGLMIRCGQENGIEILVALLRPLSFRAHPTVQLNFGGEKASFPAKVVAPGTLVLLPEGATALANGPWQQAKELDIAIDDPELSPHGTIPLDGLSSGMANLQASCTYRNPEQP